MKTRPKPVETEKQELNAPEKGSTPYWIHTIFLFFVMPFIAFSVAIIQFISSYGFIFYFPGFIAAATIAFFLTRWRHKYAMAMDDEAYKKSFNPPNITQVEGMDFTNPFNPASPLYRLIGPGRRDN